MKNRKRELKNTVVLADAIGILVCVLVLTFAMETRTTEFAAALIGLISVPALIFIGIGLLYWIATTM